MPVSGSGHQDFAESLYFHIAEDALNRANEAAKLPSGDAAEWERKKAVATVIIFSALCLEAFINRCYYLQGKPSGRSDDRGRWHEFAHKDKWLTLPQRLEPANPTFDLGQEPFLTFLQLVEFRNQRSVHFQPKREGSDTIPVGLPAWAEEIGNVTIAEKYLVCVADMVNKLHDLTKGKTPKAEDSIRKKYTRHVWAAMTTPAESRGPKA